MGIVNERDDANSLVSLGHLLVHRSIVAWFEIVLSAVARQSREGFRRKVSPMSRAMAVPLSLEPFCGCHWP